MGRERRHPAAAIVCGGWVVLRLTGSLSALFAALSIGLIVYGLVVLAAVRTTVFTR